MSKAKLVLALLVVGLGVLLYLELASPSTAATGEPFNTLDIPVDRPQSIEQTTLGPQHLRGPNSSEELRELRQRIEELERQNAVVSGPANGSPRLDPIRDPEAYDAMLTENRERAYHELMEVFDAEPPSAGGPDAEEEITTFFDEKWSGVEVGEVDCGSRMCRTELSFMGENHLNAFLDDGLSESPLRYGGQFLQRGDEPSDYVVFTARKGQKLAEIMRARSGERK